ncbi:MAG: recombinase family protein [Chloroflexi bacterium]|nr:recombinase family protein [Chloroflexota bacterium]
MKSQAAETYQRGGHRGLDPFGYRTIRLPNGIVQKPRTLEVVPQEAYAVHRIVNMAATTSHKAIAHILTAEGVLNPSGGRWTQHSVKDITRRGELYLGYVVRGRGDKSDGKRIKGTHQPIITEEEWRAMVDGLQRRTHGRVQLASVYRCYPLSGVFRCGLCGGTMSGQYNFSRDRAHPGRRNYICRNCSAEPRQRSVDADAADLAVRQRIAAAVLSDPDLDEMRDMLAARNGAPADNGRAMRDTIDEQIRRLDKMYLRLHIDEADYESQRRDLERDRSALPTDNGLDAFDVRRVEFLGLAEAVLWMTPELLKEAIGGLCEAIYTDERGVGAIIWTRPARPFFNETVLRELRPRTDSNRRRAP